jgi:hypothetical protein
VLNSCEETHNKIDLYYFSSRSLIQRKKGTLEIKVSSIYVRKQNQFEMKSALQYSMKSSYEAEDSTLLMRNEVISLIHPPLQRPKSFPNIKSGNDTSSSSSSQIGPFLMISTMEVLRGKSLNDLITVNASSNLSPIASTASFDVSDGQTRTATSSKQLTKSCKNCCFMFRVPASTCTSTSSSRLCGLSSSCSSSSSLSRSTSFNRLSPSFSSPNNNKKRTSSEESIIFFDQEDGETLEGNSTFLITNHQKEIIIPPSCVSPSPLSPTKLTEFCSKDCETSYNLFYANSSVLPSPQRERAQQHPQLQHEKEACRIADIRQSIYAFQQQLLKQEMMTSTTTATAVSATATATTVIVNEIETKEGNIEKPTVCLSKANSEESIDLMQFINIAQWWKSSDEEKEDKEIREEKAAALDINNGGMTSNENSPVTTPVVSVGKKKIAGGGNDKNVYPPLLTEEQQQEKDLQKAAKKKFDTKYFEELKKDRKQLSYNKKQGLQPANKKGKKETKHEDNKQTKLRSASDLSFDADNSTVMTTTGFLSSLFGFTQPKPLRPQLHAFI